MARDFGRTDETLTRSALLGGHPTITTGITIASTGTAVDYAAGAVLGKITSGGKYALHDDGSSDGSQLVAGLVLLAEDVTIPASGDMVTVAYIHGEFKEAELSWHATADAACKAAAIIGLTAKGIYCT